MYKHIKNISFAILLIGAFSATVITACKKKSTSSTVANTSTTTSAGIASCGEGLLCGKLDGKDYVADPYSTNSQNGLSMGSYAYGTSSGSGSTFSIDGSKSASGEGIGILIYETPQTGHTYSSADGKVVFDYVQGSGTSVSEWITDGTTANAGTVTITKYDASSNVISGTFSFTARSTQNTSTHTFSNGAFTNVKVIK